MSLPISESDLNEENTLPLREGPHMFPCKYAQLIGMHVVSALLGVLHLFTTLRSSHHISLGLLALAQVAQQAHRLVRISVTVGVSIRLGLGLGSAMQRKP